MIDDYYGAAWAEHHARLGNEIAHRLSALVAMIMRVFEHLHTHQFDAPWHRDTEAETQVDAAGHDRERRLIGWNW